MTDDRRLRATLVGFVAVLLWALLALFTTWSRGLPPFQLLAITFAVASLVGLAWLAASGKSLSTLRQPAAAWVLSVGGLFGYHFFYFVALGNAPAVDASLIAYLWPVLIVVFSALLPGERLRWFHLAGGLLGLLGAALLVTGGGDRLDLDPAYGLGYLAAAACALTWSGYSVANRRFGAVPTEAVTGFCAAVALLGLVSHLLLEETVAPTAGQWIAAVLLGLGPVGAAFFVWDYGTKHGNLQVLGASAYAAPLLSTLILVAVGEAEASWTVALACLLIVGGAVLASRELLFRRRAPA